MIEPQNNRVFQAESSRRRPTSLLRKTILVARRVLGDSHELTLRMRMSYASTLFESFKDHAATFDDLREAVTTLKEIEPTARRVLGGANPLAIAIAESLRSARDVGAALDRCDR